MAKSRVKSVKPAIMPIADWHDADDLLREIATAQRNIAAFEADAERAIHNIKVSLKAKVDPRLALIDLYVRSLEAFCSQHIDDFGSLRSRKLDFGTVGWRKSPPAIRTKKTTLEAIKCYFTKAKAALYIRVKEEVDKEALAKLTDEELRLISARREVTEAFFAECDITKVANYGA